MFQLHSSNLNNLSKQFYWIYFSGLSFSLLPPYNFGSLSFFSPSKQKSHGKIPIKIDLDWYQMHHQLFKQANIVFCTDYRQLFLLPFLIQKNPDLIVFCTNLAKQLAKIHISDIIDKIKDKNATSQTLSYFEQGEIWDRYEQESEKSFENWRQIYKKQTFLNFLEKVKGVNYYQEFNTQKGVVLKAYPSGKNNGGCIWQIQSTTSLQKLLVVKQISTHRWRTCRPFQLSRLKESHAKNPFNQVLFLSESLQKIQNQQQLNLSLLVKEINNAGEQRKNQIVVLDDPTLCIDLIRQIQTKPSGKFQNIITNQVFQQIHSFVNTYVDYLSDEYRKILFSKQPDYPLLHYYLLKKSGRVNCGQLSQLALANKLPIHQFILQSSPFVYFVNQVDYYLETAQINYFQKIQTPYDITKISFGSTLTLNFLNEFCQALPGCEFLGYHNKEPSLFQISPLQLGKYYNFKKKQQKVYYTVRNYQQNSILHFNYIKNQLYLKQKQDKMIVVPSDFLQITAKKLLQRGSIILNRKAKYLQTQKTSVSISEEYQLLIQSKNSEQIFLIDQLLQQFSTPYKLNKNKIQDKN